MLDILLYSIANKKTNDLINVELQKLLDSGYLSKREASIIQHTITVSDRGGYPSPSYYENFYGKPEYTFSSLQEILNLCSEVYDFYKRQNIQSSIIQALNDSDSSSALVESLSNIASTNETSDISLDEFHPIKYSTFDGEPEEVGIKLGVPEIDKLTNGFQPGTIASIGGFTGHGKCQSGDARVLLDQGYLPLKSLVSNPKPGWNDVSGFSYNDNPIKGVYYSKNNKVNVVKFSNGLTLKMTNDHQVQSLDGNLVKVGSLHSGDYVALSRVLPPFKIVREEALKYFFYGLWLGDGGRQIFGKGDRLTIGSKDKSILDFYKDWDCHSTNVNKVHNCYYTISRQLESSKLKDLIELTNSSDKSINDSVYGSLDRMILTILGLFYADSCIYVRNSQLHLDYSTTSRVLSNQVREILQCFGIATKSYNNDSFYVHDGVRKSSKLRYTIRTKGHSLCHLMTLCSTIANSLGLPVDSSRFFNSYYDNLKKVGTDSGIHNCSWDVVKLSVEDFDKLSSIIPDHFDYESVFESLYKDFHKKDGLVRQGSLWSILDHLPESSIKSYLYGTYLAFQSIKVDYIAPHTMDVYDIEVSNIHRYYSNGILQHNSTCLVSCVYNNLLEGKKVLFISLEMPVKDIWLQFQTRFLYDNGIELSTQDLFFRKLTPSVAKQVAALDGKFDEKISSNLLIIDESVLSKQLLLNYKAFNSFLKNAESKLGGLDAICLDHIGQMELLYPDCGNRIIKTLQSSAKTYINGNGKNIVVLLAVQANREGEKRARRRDGVYDLQSIADLNECGASRTQTRVRDSERYLTFGQVVKRHSQGVPMQVECVDYTTGAVKYTTITDAFKVSEVDSSYEWRKLHYSNSGESIILTPSHRVLVDGVKTKLSELPEEFKADYVDWNIKGKAREVLLGTLLGDSVISKSDDKTDRYCIRMEQGGAQLDYLKWKVEALGYEFMGPINQQGNRNVYVSCSKSFIPDNILLCTKTSFFKTITEELLNELTPLSLLVWYLDDGCKVNDSLNSYHVVFSCTNFGLDGAYLMLDYLRNKYGYSGVISYTNDIRSLNDQIQIRLHPESSRKFLEMVSPLIDIEQINYKLDSSVGKNLQDISPIKRELIRCGLKVSQTKYKFRNQLKTKLRGTYNFTVEDFNHNYLLPGGLVSANCERSSSYIVFLYTSDDMKVVQETKVSLSKNRKGSVTSEPVITTFNPAVCLVGSPIEEIQVDDDVLSSVTDFDFDDLF